MIDINKDGVIYHDVGRNNLNVFSPVAKDGDDNFKKINYVEVDYTDTEISNSPIRCLPSGYVDGRCSTWFNWGTAYWSATFETDKLPLGFWCQCYSESPNSAQCGYLITPDYIMTDSGTNYTKTGERTITVTEDAWTEYKWVPPTYKETVVIEGYYTTEYVPAKYEWGVIDQYYDSYGNLQNVWGLVEVEPSGWKQIWVPPVMGETIDVPGHWEEIEHEERTYTYTYYGVELNMNTFTQNTEKIKDTFSFQLSASGNGLWYFTQSFRLYPIIRYNKDLFEQAVQNFIGNQNDISKANSKYSYDLITKMLIDNKMIDNNICINYGRSFSSTNWGMSIKW